MPNTMVCTFCKNKGVPTPHNHTVRNWTYPINLLFVLNY